MDFFSYRRHRLYCEGVPVDRLAKLYGTPLYIYSASTIREHYLRLTEAFPSALVCYSLKANSNLNICRILKDLGSGFDVVSGGELARVLAIGADPSKIIFAGVGKTVGEITLALKGRILMINAESIDEIQTIEKIARKLKLIARVGLRINPDISAHTHRYLTTAVEEAKFGLSLPDASRAMKLISPLKHLKLIGLHWHIGSQITSPAPYLKALKKILPLIGFARKLGHPLEYLDTGGGFGIFYKGMEARPAQEFAQVILPLVKNLKLIIEPGRFIVGNAGIIITRVIRTKTSYHNNFVICDAGMNTLIRPALYGAYHRIEPVRPTRGSKIKADVVGPICESGDFLGKARLLPKLKNNDLLAVFSAGAYGYSMSSNYNTRPKPAEVLVTGTKHKIISRPEKFEDMVRLEKL